MPEERDSLGFQRIGAILPSVILELTANNPERRRELLEQCQAATEAKQSQEKQPEPTNQIIGRIGQ